LFGLGKLQLVLAVMLIRAISSQGTVAFCLRCSSIFNHYHCRHRIT